MCSPYSGWKSGGVTLAIHLMQMPCLDLPRKFTGRLSSEDEAPSSEDEAPGDTTTKVGLVTI